MPLFLDETQETLADTVRPFMAGEAPVSHLRALRDADDAAGFSRDLWRQFGEMGFTGVLVEETDVENGARAAGGAGRAGPGRLGRGRSRVSSRGRAGTSRR